MIEFRLPSLGSDMDEGKLLQWNVAPGQAVKKGDVVAVVDTSKAAVDVEVWVDGTVQRLVTEIGQTIPVGTVMALLRAPGEAVPPDLALGQAGASPAPPVALVPAGAPAAALRKDESSPFGPPAAVAATTASRQRVTPAARRRAAAFGVDLTGMIGSGADGAIQLEDVERAAARRAGMQPLAGEPFEPAPAAPAGFVRSPTAAPPAAPSAAPTEATPTMPATMPSTARPAAPPTLQRAAADKAAEMRKAIAAAMARSKREIPHYYLSEAVPMRKALDWLSAQNAQRPVTARLLPAVLLLKAVALALRGFPEINGLFVDGSFRPSAAAHIGVAISLRQGGLVAPALHDVGSQSLDELMRGLADLVKRCRAGSLRSSEMSDPTITVTHLGEQGVDAVFGVIYPPQVALVGFGRIADRPWVEDGRATVMPALTASLSADHRVSDGHRGAQFLTRLRELLQRPQDL